MILMRQAGSRRLLSGTKSLGNTSIPIKFDQFDLASQINYMRISHQSPNNTRYILENNNLRIYHKILTEVYKYSLFQNRENGYLFSL